MKIINSDLQCVEWSQPGLPGSATQDVNATQEAISNYQIAKALVVFLVVSQLSKSQQSNYGRKTSWWCEY